jgi:hypothetical protein
MLVDESASATVKQLGEALTDIEVIGHIFGHVSLTLVLYNEDRRTLQHQAAEASKALAVHDGAFFDETYNFDPRTLVSGAAAEQQVTFWKRGVSLFKIWK